jgi:hypothetical protein
VVEVSEEVSDRHAGKHTPSLRATPLKRGTKWLRGGAR